MPTVDTFVQSYGRSNQINSYVYRRMDWISKRFAKYLHTLARYRVRSSSTLSHSLYLMPTGMTTSTIAFVKLLQGLF